uniref:Opsin n=1 Tax=Hydra vulgaris TaxID=6087 RepID=A0A857GWW4_HYDVU|nr:opsin [Hydra vulgaris]
MTACYIILFKVKKKEITHLFIVSISITNLLETTIGLTPQLMMANEFLLERTPLCIVSGFSVLGFAITNITHLTILSFIRTVAIKYPLQFLRYNKMFWCRATLIFVCYANGFFWAILPIIGWSKYELDLDKQRCSLDWRLTKLNSFSYILSIFICCNILPGIVIVLMLYFSKKTIYRRKGRKICQSRETGFLEKEYLRCLSLPDITHVLVICYTFCQIYICSEYLFNQYNLYFTVYKVSFLYNSSFILQHPREQDFRQLTTVPLLQECIPKDKCKVYRGKRFPAHKFPEVHDVLDRPNTILLFPSKDGNNWAVRENFSDIVEFIRDLGDKEIDSHFKIASKQAANTSSTSDQFVKIISNKLDNEVCIKIILAHDLSVLADETSDVADKTVFSVFIRYVDSDSHTIEEMFLGLVQVIGRKDAQIYVNKYN